MSKYKYIIKNCPANYPVLGWEECLCGDTECQDCNDCVMKQIVDLCKGNQKLKWQVGQNPEEWISFNNPLSYQILQLLDIQEVG